MDVENKYGMLEMQQYCLPIMDHIDDICRKNSIKYTLSDGTLIGAIRHHGFIPWDDDIDIAFDRKEYCAFIDVLEKELEPDYMIIRDQWIKRITRKDNPWLEETPPKGCIDLFVFDNVPDGKNKNRIKNILLKILQGMLKREVSYDGFSIYYRIALCLTHYMGILIPWKTKQKMFDIISQWDNDKETEQKARYCGSYRCISKIRYPSNITGSYTDVDFENRKYMSLEDWDTFLTIDYGDYMQVPPEEERIVKHKTHSK